ncbi:hypothetical protein DEA8626_00844 [Defluviimonas aquaemixtae]|uniref:CENP-V/GFA domain-containing protein n=1 Tax=Albidovulum aquaemixtae TaxID=1542388 RepID=A0A2R8B3Y3_9RHOB|nr:GFA family protein [Defluviimonas aquaemixtae]SPH17326.1 hypothetical protein DEA8626_00844 [Defluviimonas aquaemixtae]
MSNAALSGTCLCGACAFTAAPVGKSAGACHCGMCRRWSGGIYLAVDCGESVEFAKGAPVVAYKGSSWGERLFCRECGSSLVWQTQDGRNQHVSIQTFEDPGRFVVDSEIFIDRKPNSYALADVARAMTEAEVFAMFASKSEGGQ